MKAMNVLVVGLGALGVTFATLLKKAGHNVCGLTKDKYLPILSEKPLRVSGIWGVHEAPLDGAFSSIEPLKNKPIDVIIITVKSFDTETAARQIAPLVGPGTIVVSAQNGYGNYETVAKAVGKKHTLLARIIFGARLVAPGHAEVTVIADDVRMGQPEAAIAEERGRAIASAINQAGIPTQYAPDVNSILWDKILYNCALNPLGALLDCNYGSLAEHEATRTVMNEIIAEILAVARAHGIALKWNSAEEYQKHFYTRLVPPTKEHFPSMYHDLKAGKRLEIDALNGSIVRLGKEKGVPVPVNETITDLIKAKERLTAK